MQKTAELSELDVETVWPELVGPSSVDCGWVNAHSRWVRIPRGPLFTQNRKEHVHHSEEDSGL